MPATQLGCPTPSPATLRHVRYSHRLPYVMSGTHLGFRTPCQVCYAMCLVLVRSTIRDLAPYAPSMRSPVLRYGTLRARYAESGTEIRGAGIAGGEEEGGGRWHPLLSQ
eukprot:451851-Rhodomonas_salina.1